MPVIPKWETAWLLRENSARSALTLRAVEHGVDRAGELIAQIGPVPSQLPGEPEESGCDCLEQPVGDGVARTLGGG
jgi:hypothetical protein